MILYYPKFSIDIFLLIPFFFFISLIYNYRRKKTRFMGCIIWGIISFSLLFINILFSVVPIYDFYTGNYKVVEGYTENFSPRPPGGHASESFTINGVGFEYSEGIIKPGYNRSFYNGGVIKGNKQHLRIGYSNEYSEGNSIIFIESPPFSKAPSEQIPYFYPFKIPILIICICILFALIYCIHKKSNIKIDYYKSYIKDYFIDNDHITIQCNICFNNTFKCEKKIKLYGHFKREKGTKPIKKLSLEGVPSDPSDKILKIPVGISKSTINFTVKGLITDFNINKESLILPKMSIKILD